MKRKQIIIFVCCLILTSILVACGESGQTQESGQNPGQNTVVINQDNEQESQEEENDAPQVTLSPEEMEFIMMMDPYAWEFEFEIINNEVTITGIIDTVQTVATSKGIVTGAAHRRR